MDFQRLDIRENFIQENHHEMQIEQPFERQQA